MKTNLLNRMFRPWQTAVARRGWKNTSLLAATMIMFASVISASATVLLTEDFNYTAGTLLTANGWTAHSSGGTAPITVVTPSPALTYSTYSAGGGNAVALPGSGEDDNRTITTTSSGSVYMAFLVNASAATTGGDYFTHFMQGPTTFFGRIYVKKDASGNVAFGLGKTSETAQYTAFNYSLNTTYLVVLKYTFNTGTTTDDTVALYVNPLLGGSEPAATIGPITTSATDSTGLIAIALRQGGSSAPNVQVDGIRVATTWSEAVPTIGGGTPPTITDISPLSATANAGTTVQFTVTSTGDAPSYFWYKETASATNLISGATTATLTLTNVVAADTASYQVVLTNASGSDTSAVVSLTVTDPAINTQPASATRLAGGSATFSVVAGGTPTLGYQWYSKPTSDNFDFSGATAYANTGNVSGADTSALTITNLSSADVTNLYVVVTSSGGSVTSSVVTLSVAYSASLAYWNFNGSFLNTTSPVPFTGVGTASLVNCSGFSNNIYSGNDFDFTLPAAWGTQNYPTNGNLANNKTAGVRYNVSTLGAKNIAITFDAKPSGTASKYARLQFTTNGTDFIDFPASYSLTSDSIYSSRGFNLSGFPGVNNNTNFGVRLVSEFESTATYGTTNNDQYVGATSAYGTGGTLSYDIVNITGDAITNANTAPTISSFTNVIMTDLDAPLVLNFTVGDVETAAGSLTVSVTSSNQAVIPDGNLVLGGSSASRTLTITPVLGALGGAPILVTVTDGNNDVTTTWFYVTVEPGNQPPTITGLVNTNTLGNITNTYAFTIGDDVTAVGSLTLSATSGNTTLVPNDSTHLYFGGSGSNRTLSVVSAADQYGIAPITVTVGDGQKNTSQTFVLQVRPNLVTLLNDGFDYDGGGDLTGVSAGFWVNNTGSGKMQVNSGKVTVTDAIGEDVTTPLIGQPYSSATSPVMYASFKLNFSALPTVTNAYFAHFKNSSSTFYARVYASTAFAEPGKYRIGIANGSTTGQAGQIAQDLSTGVEYTIVTRLVLSNGVSTIWINPTSESDPSVTDNISGSAASVVGYSLREATGEGTMTIDNLKVAMNFLSAVSNIVDIPPQANPDGYTVAGNSVTNVLSPLTNDVLNLAVGTLSLVSVSATNGTASISGTNVLFTPTPSFAGTATVGYTINDGFGGTSTSLMTVTVVGPSGPTPLNMNVSGSTLTFNWSDPLFNLQSATNVAGPYVTIPGAVSGFSTNVTTAPAMFFRLKF